VNEARGAAGSGLEAVVKIQDLAASTRCVQRQVVCNG